ncbi:MAG: SpoIIE family protein phosphatase [Planctomycetes bacterium]|nr:SpoIIE family protein phosphatase [Planctomycetota bacterium]
MRKWAILTALLLTLCAVAVLYGLDRLTMTTVYRDARLINVAGRQRMLSQRLAKAAVSIELATSANEVGVLRREIGDTLAEWQTFHEALRQRDPKQNLQGTNSPEILALLLRIHPHYQSMREAAGRLASGKSEADDNGVALTGLQQCRQILEHESAYLTGMDRIVNAYQQEAQGRVRTSQRFKAMATLLACVALVALWFLVFQRTNQLERALRQLADEMAGSKRANRALKNSEERFALAAQGSSDGIWDWNVLTNDVFISARLKELLGYEDHEFENKFASFESHLHSDDRQRVLAAVRDHLKRRVAYEVEYRLRTKSGQYRWFVARGQALWDDTGKATRMAGSIMDITEHRLSQGRLREREAGLLAAQRIQERLLPQSAPDLAGFDIAGAVHPAEFAGGDYFDYLDLQDGALGVLVGDVSGHGVSSSLLTAAASSHIRSYAEMSVEIDEILARTNSLLASQTEGNPFVTLFFARIDPQTRSLSYINAGHPPGYVLDKSGAVKATLNSGTLPLAVQPDTEFPIGGPVVLETGDTVLLITDGVLEAMSPGRQMFGAERMLEVVRENRAGCAREIIDGLYRAIRDFTQRDQTMDDVTIVVIRLTESPNPAHLSARGIRRLHAPSLEL